jgi:hypothetical protein
VIRVFLMNLDISAWWPVGALLFSGFGALIVGFNQWANLPGVQLVRWRCVGVWPLALLGALLLPWPTAGGFYATAVAMGVGLAVADALLFNASRVHGARLAALYIPLKMLLAFVGWAILVPTTLWPLVTEVWRLPLLLVGFGVCSGAMLFIRRSDASWAGLLAVVPVAVLFALGDVVAKLALPPVQGGLLAVAGSAVAFLTVTTTTGAVVSLWLKEGDEAAPLTWPGWRTVRLSAAFGALLLTGLTLLLVVLALAPNPGYVAAITMLSAVWLAVWARWRRGERNNLWAGLALIFGAMCVGVAGH